jgi:hypothetical protein
MPQIFGEYRDDLPKGNEYLILRFSPTSVPLKERWRNNGLSANFMADYMATFFPGESVIPVKSAVSFIANELIENAMKYSDQSSEFPVTIALYLYRDKLIFLTNNSIAKPQVETFQNFLKELTESDPAELWLQHLEQNAAEEDSDQSGLGFLSMINDYQAELGWKFEDADPNGVAVSTMVQLRSESL